MNSKILHYLHLQNKDTRAHRNEMICQWSCRKEDLELSLEHVSSDLSCPEQCHLRSWEWRGHILTEHNFPPCPVRVWKCTCAPPLRRLSWSPPLGPRTSPPLPTELCSRALPAPVFQVAGVGAQLVFGPAREAALCRWWCGWLHSGRASQCWRVRLCSFRSRSDNIPLLAAMYSLLQSCASKWLCSSFP